MRRVLLILMALAISTPGAAQTVNVITGDTITYGGIIMRLAGVMAPRRDDVCMVDGVEIAIGAFAAAELGSIIGNQWPICRPRVGLYHRGEDFLVRCQVYLSRMRDGEWITELRDISNVLVEKGAALDFPPESLMAHAPAEDLAMRTERGVWVGDCHSQLNWRRRFTRIERRFYD